MKKLKLLFITKDQSKQMERSSHYLAEALKKQCDAMVHTEGGQISEILKALPVRPDFILLNDGFAPKLCPRVHGLDHTEIPKGVFFHDLTNNIFERTKFVAENQIDVIFSHYRDPFKKRYPRLIDRMVWLPHHANTEIFKDYESEKEINWLMMGEIHPIVYPLRALIKGTFEGQEGFLYHPHPGYHHEDEIARGSLIAEDYAKEINRAKMFLTCDSIYRYPVMKYFEVPACHTLLLAPASAELTDLGFVDGETFVAVDKYNFYEKANYYLHNEEERKRITDNGFRMVRDRHSTEQRVQELLWKIEEILTKKKGNEA